MVNICVITMLIEKKRLIKYLVDSKEKGTSNRWEIENSNNKSSCIND